MFYVCNFNFECFTYLERLFVHRIYSIPGVETCVGGHTGGDVANIGDSAGVDWIIVENKVIIVSVTMKLANDGVLKP